MSHIKAWHRYSWTNRNGVPIYIILIPSDLYMNEHYRFENCKDALSMRNLEDENLEDWADLGPLTRLERAVLYGY